MNPNNDNEQMEDNTTVTQGGAVTASRPVREPTVAKKERRFSWVWLVPIIAIVVGLSVLGRMWLNTGPTITVTFASADGLSAGQTQLRYRDIVVGQVTGLTVADDRKQVEVHIQLDKQGSEYITQAASKFWVVRPRLGISGVSGLGTLLSGAYISVDAPTVIDKDAEAVTDFTGLESPPEVSSARPGKRFNLQTKELGSLEIGSPVYFRGISVGQVIGYSLDEGGEGVSVQVFIDAPNDLYVTTLSRFWNASGINLELDAAGLALQTTSLVSALAGGIVFDTGERYLEKEERLQTALVNQHFVLYPNQEAARAKPDGEAFHLIFNIPQSIRGLKVGAPIDFQGLELGKVTAINLDFDMETQRFFSVVEADIYPLRLGAVYEHLLKHLDSSHEPIREFMSGLVRHGLRAQMRSGNLLTGQQYIALDFYPNAAAVPDFDPNATPLVLPVIKGEFDRLQQQVSSILTKLDSLPLEKIGVSLEQNLQSLNTLVKHLDDVVVPSSGAAIDEAQRVLARIESLLQEGSPFSSNIEQSLEDLQRALRGLTDVTTELQSQPSSFIRGRAPDKLPESRR